MLPDLKDAKSQQESAGDAGDASKQSCCGFDVETPCGATLCQNTKALCFLSFLQPPLPKKPPSDAKDAAETSNIRVITVEFNAWEYSGCDYLWAGIVTNLGSRIEDYFGVWKVRLCRLLLKRADDNRSDLVRSLAVTCCYMRCKLWTLLLCLLSLLALSATVVTVLGIDWAQSEIDTAKKTRFIVAVTSFSATVTTLLAGEERVSLLSDSVCVYRVCYIITDHRLSLLSTFFVIVSACLFRYGQALQS